MNTQQILEAASQDLKQLSGHVFDLLTISKPISPDAAVNLTKVISKLSPLIGNLIEFNTVEFLNDQPVYQKLGKWKRQDPDFPDAIFEGVEPTPGFEIKAWFPLATEITARFKDSQNHFTYNQTNVCLLAWLPDKLIYGQPKIIDVCIVSGLSVAQARDNHYHNPPDYLVLEPEDTTTRTRNLQQTNTNGYKWQADNDADRAKAQVMVENWGKEGKIYSPTPEYQQLLRELMANFPYRLDTNFAKMDRIAHPTIELFKNRVLNTKFHNLTIREWNRILYRGHEDDIKITLKKQFNIVDGDTNEIIE